MGIGHKLEVPTIYNGVNIFFKNVILPKLGCTSKYLCFEMNLFQN